MFLLVYSFISVLGNMVVAVVCHPEKAILVTGDPQASTQLVGECVDKCAVRTVDPETSTSAILADGNVALSVNSNTCGCADGPRAIACDLCSLWCKDFDTTGAVSSNMKIPLKIKSKSPGVVIAGEGIGKTVVFIENLDTIVSVVSYENLS